VYYTVHFAVILLTVTHTMLTANHLKPVKMLTLFKALVIEEKGPDRMQLRQFVIPDV